MPAWYDALWPLLQRAVKPGAGSSPEPGTGVEGPADLSALALAYLGDAVYEAYVRARLLSQRSAKPEALHQGAVARVRAVAQALALQELEPCLTDEERSVVRRARNTRPGHVPRGTRPADYHRSTAFEALLGHLLVTGQVERLESLLGQAWSAVSRGLDEPS